MPRFLVVIVLWLPIGLGACSPLDSEIGVSDQTNTVEQDSWTIYQDQDVEKFLEQFPILAAPAPERTVPRDILEKLEIDTNRLRVIEQIFGGCITLTVYELSKSYELVVDDNPCSGYQVLIKKR